jgi:hypothetical protein
MDIEIVAEPEHLVIRHAVVNASDEPIYLLNRLLDWYGIAGRPELDQRRKKGAPPTTEIAFVNVRDDHAAVFFQGNVPPPAGRDLYGPRIAYGTRLEPGATYRGEIRAPLPLLEWHSYEIPTDEDADRIEIWRVALRIAYFGQSEAPKAREHANFAGSWVVTWNTRRVFEAEAELAVPCIGWRRRSGLARFV